MRGRGDDTRLTLTDAEAEEVYFLIGDPEDHYGDPDHPLRTLKERLERFLHPAEIEGVCVTETDDPCDF